MQKNNNVTTTQIYGELLFDLIHIGSLINISPEDSLSEANKRYIKIFTLIKEYGENNFKNMDNGKS